MKENFNSNEYRENKAQELSAIRKVNKEVAYDYSVKMQHSEEYQLARQQTREDFILHKKLTLDDEKVSIKDENVLKAEATLSEIKDSNVKSRAKLFMLKELASHGNLDDLKNEIKSLSVLRDKIDGLIYIEQQEKTGNFSEIVELLEEEWKQQDASKEKTNDEDENSEKGRDFSNLLELASVQVEQGNVDQMIETLNKFVLKPGSVTRSEYSVHRNMEVKDQIYERVCKQALNRGDTNTAQLIISHPQFDGYKDDIVKEICRKQINDNKLEEAEQTAKKFGIQLDFRTEKVKKLINEAKKEDDFSEAKKAAHTLIEDVKKNDNGWGRADLLIAIAEKEGKGDFAEAMKVINEAKKDNHYFKDYEPKARIVDCLIKIGKYEEAKKYFGDNGKGKYDDNLLGKIAQAQVLEGNLNEAKKNYNLVADEYEKHYIAIEIAEAQLKMNDVEGAKKTLEKVNAFIFDWETKELNLLLEIAEKDGTRDYERAKELAASDDNQYRKPKYFSLIAEKEGKGDFAEAKKWTHSIRSDYSYYGEGCTAIACAQAKTGFVEDALETVNEFLTKEDEKGNLLEQIIEILIQKNDIEAAKNAANKITSPYYKSRALIRIGDIERDYSEAKLSALSIRDVNTKNKIFIDIASHQFRNTK